MFILKQIMCYLFLSKLANIINCKKGTKLRIMHINDFRSKFDEMYDKTYATCLPEERKEGRCCGGMARLVAEVRRQRAIAAKDGVPIIFLNAGNVFGGSLWFSVHNSTISTEFTNLLKPDASALGFEEFSYGVDVLAYYLNNAKFPIVCANVNATDMRLQKIQDTTILSVAAGLKVAIVGYTRKISVPDFPVTFEDPFSSIQRYITALHNSDVDLIIALGCDSIEMDEKIAALTSGLHVIIGGGSKELLWNGPKPECEDPTRSYPFRVNAFDGSGCYILQAFAYGKYLGYWELTFDDTGTIFEYSGNPILLDSRVPQAPDILKTLNKFRPALRKYLHRPIGQLNVWLDGANAVCNRQECLMGNVMADALIAYVAETIPSPYWTTASVSIISAGLIAADINPFVIGRNISRYNVSMALPYWDEIYLFTAQGSELKASFEHAAEDARSFLQVSGVRVKIDKSRPVGERVVFLALRCGDCDIPRYEILKDNKYYNIVSHRFCIRGYAGHVELRHSSSSFGQMSLFKADNEIFTWYLEKMSPLHAEYEDRIILVDKGHRKQSAFLIANISIFVIITEFIYS